MKSKVFGFVSAVGFLATTVGCGVFELSNERANDKVNPERPTWATRPSGVMNVLYRQPITSAKFVDPDGGIERGRPEFDLARARLFVGSSDHGLYALRATDGSTLWRFETLGAVEAEPYYDAELDYVYFGSSDGALYAVRAQDGGLVFRYDTKSDVARRPVRVGETLLFTNSADYLFAIDRRSGKPKWQAHRPSASGMEISGHAGTAVFEDLAFMAYSDGTVTAYDVATGAEKWSPIDLAAEADNAGDAPKYLDSDTTPLVFRNGDRGLVVVANVAAGVVALDARTGSRVWTNERALGVSQLGRFEEPFHAPSKKKEEPAVPERRMVLAASGTTGLWAFEVATGKVLWRNTLPAGGITAPVAVSGAVAVGTARYGLFLLSPVDGRAIDGIDPGTGFTQAPVAFADRVWALSNGGVLYGIGIASPFAPARRTDPYATVLR